MNNKLGDTCVPNGQELYIASTPCATSTPCYTIQLSV